MAKTRFKKKGLLSTIIVLALLGYTLFNVLYYLSTTKEERALKKLNYSEEAISLIVENKLDKYLINNNLYSKTLDVALTEGNYEESLLDEYIALPYKDYDDYITQLNELYNIGYKRKDIESVFKNFDEEKIDIIIDKKQIIKNLANLIENDYFHFDNLDRYENYQSKNPTFEPNKVVSYVNMHLDYPFYEKTIDALNQDDLLVIANKYYKLSSNFKPKDLVTIDKKDSYNNYTFQIKAIVKEKFNEINNDMAKEGLSLLVKSAYRSYQTQVDLYNDYVRDNGKTRADAYSARAGHSEHQTGLAIDVCARNSCSYGSFVGTKEYKWMLQNAHKYGFILRYPENKTYLTGYGFESWHYRYVGVEVAKYIYDNDLTFDEYHAMKTYGKGQ